MSRQTSFNFGDEPTTAPAEPVSVSGAEPRVQPRAQPLDYELRVSPRARHLSLRVVHGRGLVVTIPKRFPRRDVPEAVEAHRDWALNALADLVASTPEIYRQWPPRCLDLAAIGVRVVLAFASDAGDTRDSSNDREWCLALGCTPDDRAAVAMAVAQWLRPIAVDHLKQLSSELAARHGLSYQRLSVRGQRSVWGSYSSSGTLSLNYKLMFLRPDIVEYVIQHELAHTRHLDHSDAFWSTLAAMNPRARALDKELGAAGQRVPPWLELAR